MSAVSGSASDRSDRLAAEPGDLVGVLVAPAGEADDDDRVARAAGGLLDGLGHGVARFQGGEDAFELGEGVIGLERLGVGDALVADPAAVFPVAVLGADAGVVEPGRDRVDVLGLAVVVLEDVAEAAVEDAGLALRQARRVLAGRAARVPRPRRRSARPRSSSMNG